MEEVSNALVDTDPLLRRVRWIARQFISRGKTKVTFGEILTEFANDRVKPTGERVGRALSVLGIQGRRVKVNGARYRVYDLSGGLAASGLQNTIRSGGPAAVPGAGTGSESFEHSDSRWAPDSPSEAPSRDPANPADPDD